ncbi:MAG: hypothetical protein K0U84_01785 [Actinomycetia bacterium]|nr:hypothetical protein [Actinomycetes bacterium]
MNLEYGDCPDCGPDAGKQYVITNPDGIVIYTTRNREWAMQYLRKLAESVDGVKQRRTNR